MIQKTLLTTLICIVNLSLVLSQPNCCNTKHQKKISAYNHPVFKDSALFLSDFKSKLQLKKIIDSLKNESTLGLYDYKFEIDKRGVVKPVSEEFPDQKGYVNLHSFIYEVFNSYRWAPSSKKSCKACKLRATMQLLISFNNQSGLIEMEISQINLWKSRVKRIFKEKILAENLK